MGTPKPKATRNRSSLLTAGQEKFALARASGLNAKDSMVAAGMKPNDGTANALEKLPHVQELLKAEQRRNAYMLGLTREQVLQGMMDAVEQAKILSDPLTQIAGWREIAKVCGFYAPEVKKVEISGTGKQVVDRMRQLSDAELLAIAEGEVIEVEFEEVKS